MDRTSEIDSSPTIAYGPDFAPRNFFLFGYIERKCTEYDIPDRQSLKTRSPTFSAKSDKKPSQPFSKHGLTGLNM
jgi:hypothetical protein